MKLSIKLVLTCIIVCLLPMLAVGILSTRQSSVQLEETIRSAMDTYGSQLSLSLDAMISANDQLTKSFLVDTEALRRMEQTGLSITERIDRNSELRGLLYRLSIVSQDIETVILITPDDDVICYSRTGNNVVPSRLLGKAWLRELMASRQTLNFSSAHDQSYCDRERERMVISVSRRLYDTGGSYCGMLLFDYQPSSIFPYNEAFAEMQQSYGARVQVSNADGMLMYDSEAESGTIAWNEAELLGEIREKEAISFSYTSGKGGLRVLVTAPYNRVYAAPRRLHLYALVCFAVCLVAATGTVLLITRRILRPVHQLESAMQEAEHGHYLTIGDLKSHDEIAHMALIYNEMITREKDLVERVYKAELKQEQARLIALRAQINPHMLFNTLETIRMQALIDGNEQVSDMVKTLSDMFRLSLEEDTARHTIRSEIAYTQNFIALQNMRFSDRFHLSVEIPELLLNCRIISLVFQPVVENSISHGCRDSQSRLEIVIHAEETDGDIVIRITDDGCGMRSEQINSMNDYMSGVSDVRPARSEVRSHGIGLLNINERLRLQYGARYGIRIAAGLRQGTRVEILIPKVTEEAGA